MRKGKRLGTNQAIEHPFILIHGRDFPSRIYRNRFPVSRIGKINQNLAAIENYFLPFATGNVVILRD